MTNNDGQHVSFADVASFLKALSAGGIKIVYFRDMKRTKGRFEIDLTGVVGAEGMRKLR